MIYFLVWMLLFPLITKAVDVVDRLYLNVSLSETGYAQRSKIQSGIYLAVGLILLTSAYV